MVFFLAGVPLCTGETALTALKAVPKTEARRILQVQGEGAPEPGQWRVVTEIGKGNVREYVIAAQEVVASQERPLSDEEKGQTLLTPGSIKIDSDRAGRRALRQFSAQGLTVTSISLTLQRQGKHAAPVWAVTALDADSKELGNLLVTATKGTVLSAEGLPVEPPSQPTVAVAGTPSAPSPVTDVETADREFLAGLSAPVTEPPPVTSVQPAAPEPPPVAMVEEAPAQPQSRPPKSSRSKHVHHESSGSSFRVVIPVRRIVRGLLPF